MRSYTELNGRRLGPVRSFAEDGQLRLWVASGKNLLLLKDGHLTAFLEWIGGSEIEVIYKDPKGCMWLGTDGDGLYQFENGRFRNYRSSDGLASNRVRAI